MHEKQGLKISVSLLRQYCHRKHPNESGKTESKITQPAYDDNNAEIPTRQTFSSLKICFLY